MQIDLSKEIHSYTKVCLIGLLLFIEALLLGIAPILQENRQPTTVQIMLIVVLSSLTLVTYFLTFLRGGSSDAN